MKKILLMAAIVSASGCASIVSDSTYHVAITGPDNLEYKLLNGDGFPISKGVTPAYITLDASDGYFSGADYIVQTKSECGTTATPLNSSLDPWYLGNILFGGPLGLLLVDPASGSMWKMPKMVTVNANCDVYVPPIADKQNRPLSPARKNDTY